MKKLDPKVKTFIERVVILAVGTFAEHYAGLAQTVIDLLGNLF